MIVRNITFGVSQEMAKRIEAVAEGNLSKFVREILIAYMDLYHKAEKEPVDYCD